MTLFRTAAASADIANSARESKVRISLILALACDQALLVTFWVLQMQFGLMG